MCVIYYYKLYYIILRRCVSSTKSNHHIFLAANGKASFTCRSVIVILEGRTRRYDFRCYFCFLPPPPNLSCLFHNYACSGDALFDRGAYNLELSNAIFNHSECCNNILNVYMLCKISKYFLIVFVTFVYLGSFFTAFAVSYAQSCQKLCLSTLNDVN